MPINYTLVWGIAAIFGFAGVFNSLAVWAVNSERLGRYSIRPPEVDLLSQRGKHLRIMLIGMCSIGLYAAWLYFGYDFLIRESSPGFLVSLAQIVAILLIYDFAYYWIHRLFHISVIMRHIHGMHHRVRHPTAIDGLYLDPFDLAGGLSLFFLSIALIGPVDAGTFLAVTFLHTMFNLINHTGMELPHPAFAWSNYLARKHDHHHGRNVNTNFGLMVPFWDMMFGTYE